MYMFEGERAESGDQLSDEDESDEDKIPHAVPFKCIGAALEKNYQHHLEQALQMVGYLTNIYCPTVGHLIENLLKKSNAPHMSDPPVWGLTLIGA